MILSGAGNFFTVIDNRTDAQTQDYYSKNAISLTISEGKQTDGIIILNASGSCAFSVWFVNPDGTSGMMCGNGGRCSIYAAIKYGFIEGYEDDTSIAFEVNGKQYTGKRVARNLYSIYFSPAAEYPKQVPLLENVALLGDSYKKGHFCGYYVDVGNDQYVLEVANVDEIDVNGLGKFIRYDKQFEPNGTNVNFYSYSLANNLIALRTYERGVERETGACGTGAIAAALVHIKKRGYHNMPITILPTSQSTLTVDLVLQSGADSGNVFDRIENIVLTGEVSEV
ncbi:MAG: diaminopimelate epimerase [Ignavibacteria bacterium]|jgi:diaminopimelate epimerase|nr:diaminopimelate epimerase [Ignavibacteria bacterium]